MAWNKLKSMFVVSDEMASSGKSADEVLKELGYAASEIERLRASGSV